MELHPLTEPFVDKIRNKRFYFANSRVSHIKNRLLSFEALGFELVDSIADQPDVVFTSKPTKKLDKELKKLAKAHPQHEVLVLSEKPDNTAQGFFELTAEESQGFLSSGPEGIQLARSCTHSNKEGHSLPNFRPTRYENSINLGGYILKDMDLTGAYFEEFWCGALVHCRFRHHTGNLSAKVADHLTLEDCRLSGRMSFENMVNSTLQRVSMFQFRGEIKNSRLEQVTIDGIEFRAEINRCELQEVSIGRDDHDHRLMLRECEGSNVTLHRLVNDEAEIMGCKIDNMNVQGCVFTRSVFANCSFPGLTCNPISPGPQVLDIEASSIVFTRFEGCNLKGADFSGTFFFETTFENCDLAGANFEGATLVGCEGITADNPALKGATILPRIELGPVATKSLTGTLGTDSVQLITPHTAEPLNISLWLNNGTGTYDNRIEFANLNREAKWVDWIWYLCPDGGSGLRLLQYFATAFGLINKKHLARRTWTRDWLAETVGAWDVWEEFNAIKMAEEAKQQAEIERQQSCVRALAKPDGVKHWNETVALNESFLCRYSFDGFDLRGIQFGELKLDESSFHGANLEGTDLRKTHFDWCCFDEANLQKVDFRRRRLTGCSFRNADLRGANLGGARLDDADLTGAIFDETCNWKKARFNDDTLWPEGFEIPEELIFKGDIDPRSDAETEPIVLPTGPGLHEALKLAIEVGFNLDATPGATEKLKRWAEDQGFTDNPWLEAYGRLSLPASYIEGLFEMDYYDLESLKEQHIYPYSRVLMSCGFLIIGKQDMERRLLDLDSGRLFSDIDRLAHFTENLPDDEEVPTRIFDPKRGRHLGLDSQIGRRAARRLVMETAGECAAGQDEYFTEVIERLNLMLEE